MKFGATYCPLASMIFFASKRPGGVTRGDVTSGNDDVALQNFAGVERQHLAAANDQVRLGASGGDFAQMHQLGDARRQFGADEAGLR